MDAQVAPEPLDRVILQIAVAAVQLERAVDHRASGVGREALGHRREFGLVGGIVRNLGGGENENYVCMVRTGVDGPKGISCLVIEKEMQGVSFGAQEKKLGWHSQPTAQVNFDGVRVPAENLVGGEGEGFRIAMAGLDGGRLNIGACSLGGAQRCLDEAIKYTKERKQFGTAIADFQNTQFMLADMETELQAARMLLYAAAVKVTENAPDKTKFAAMAKRLATDSGSSIVDRALQLHGGYGYLQDYPIERFWRDLRVHSILEGTNQVMRMIVGRELTRQ